MKHVELLKYPKRILAYLLVFSLLFGSSGMIPASADFTDCGDCYTNPDGWILGRFIITGSGGYSDDPEFFHDSVCYSRELKISVSSNWNRPNPDSITGWDAKSRDPGDGEISVPEGVFTWSIGDGSVLRFKGGDADALERTVIGTKIGLTTVSVTCPGGHTSTITIRVEPLITTAPENPQVSVGGRLQLSAVFAPAEASGPVGWVSQTPGIATVDLQTGVVTGVSVGKAKIMMVAQDTYAMETCEVTVLPAGEIPDNPDIPTPNPTPPPDRSGLTDLLDRMTQWLKRFEQPPPILAESLELNPTYASVEVGGHVMINAVVKPDNATDRYVKWSSADASIAVVDSYGYVTGKSPGMTTITAKTKDGSELSADAVVIVQAAKVKSVTLSDSAKTIFVGDKFTLTATVKPDNAANKSLDIANSAPNIATIDSKGVVTGLKPGTAKITYTAKDGGGARATCTVTVYEQAQYIELNATDIRIYVGDMYQLTATVHPAGAKQDVYWNYDGSYVTMRDGVVIGKQPGVCVVTAHADGGVTAACRVFVVKRPEGEGIGTQATGGSGSSGSAASNILSSLVSDIRRSLFTIRDAFVKIGGIITKLFTGKTNYTLAQERNNTFALQEACFSLLDYTFSEDNWDKCTTVEQKQAFLQQLFDKAQSYMGTSATGIVWENMGTSPFGTPRGAYEGRPVNTLYINLDYLSLKSNYDLVSTIIHELRHAFQQETVLGLNMHIVSQATIEAWARDLPENWEGAQPPYALGPGSSRDNYVTQAVEWDAYCFAKEYAELRDGYTGDFWIPDSSRAYPGIWGTVPEIR